ncbi:hypothetical protein [Streptomyces sp. NPDC093591]|uniref:hypothetical protein n=1 Tax=Streptomyces sp. NPDC093591 TaxID=3366044 RepID=UPI003809ED77
MWSWLQDLLSELFEAVQGFILVLLWLLWWIGGPGLTAIVWSEGDKRLAVGFLAAWSIVTVLYFTVSRLIRRARRA